MAGIVNRLLTPRQAQLLRHSFSLINKSIHPAEGHLQVLPNPPSQHQHQPPFVQFRLADVSEGIKEKVTLKEWILQTDDHVTELEEVKEAVQEVVQQPESITKKPIQITKKVLATPSVRRLAYIHGINLNKITGSGEDGRILKEDLKDHMKMIVEEKKPKMSSWKPPVKILDDKELCLSERARKQMTSLTTRSRLIPHFVYCDDVDLTNLVFTLKTLSISKELPKMSYDVFFLKALSLALSDFPIFNSTIDSNRQKLILKGSHNLSVAIDTIDGPILPNIKAVQNRSLVDLANELIRLQDLAQKSKLEREDMEDATFTLSNIGRELIVKPAIVDPQVAVCTFGRVKVIPEFGFDEEIVGRHVVNVSWGVDYRVVDGKTVAKFCKRWKGLIESPTQLLHYLM